MSILDEAVIVLGKWAMQSYTKSRLLLDLVMEIFVKEENVIRQNNLLIKLDFQFIMTKNDVIQKM